MPPESRRPSAGRRTRPRIDVALTRPVWDAEMEAAAVAALRDERHVGGESVARFEEAFARLCGTRHAVAVSSGTHALHFALKGLGLDARDEVLTTPMSFVASANAALHAGAEPRFADIEGSTATLDPAQVAIRATRRTRAVLAVHLYGRPAEMGALRDWCDDHQAALVEDAAQAHGAEAGGRRVGGLGVAGCFSFYPTKNMTVAGDGGMVTTNDADLAEAVRKLRDCGRRSRYEHDVLGYTARLNTVNAAVGLVQLRRLPRWNLARRRLADRYRRRLGPLAGLVLPAADRAGSHQVYHLFTVRLPRRDAAARFLAARGIETGVHYPVPIHLQPFYRSRYRYRRGRFPVAEAHARSVLSLPLHPQLTRGQQDRVVEALLAFLDGQRE